jgi:endo-1,4-beta-xylanase
VTTDSPTTDATTPLKDTLTPRFGVAIDARETTGDAGRLLGRHANQITAENHMKPFAWYDEDRRFRAHPQAVTMLDAARDGGLAVYGHVLAWHNQTPDWFFTDDAGVPLADDDTGRAILRERLQRHVHDVAEYLAQAYGPFGGGNPVVAWDVINEVIAEDDHTFGDDGMRATEWYRVLGEEVVDIAFAAAEEAFNHRFAAPGTDRPVTLFINEFNTEQPAKRARYRDLVDRLLARGVPLDGVGHQFHVTLERPIDDLAAALDAFADLPLTQAVTELDVATGVPVTDELLDRQGDYYRAAFDLFRSRQDELYSVTVWGLTDDRSWRQRQGAPTLFGVGGVTKPAVQGALGHPVGRGPID